MARRSGSGYDRLEYMDKKFNEKMSVLGKGNVVNPQIAEMAAEFYDMAATDLKRAMKTARDILRAKNVPNFDKPKYYQVILYAWKRFRRGQRPDEYMPVVEAMCRVRRCRIDILREILQKIGVPVSGGGGGGGLIERIGMG